jgi:site-specific DNA recombinase
MRTRGLAGRDRLVRRVSTEDQQDPESSRAWQLTRSRALIEPRDGQVVAEFFDVDRSRSIPWQRRPRATVLLAELKNPVRDFDAVVIAEPHRAFYGNQYGLTFPLFEHYGLPLWSPRSAAPSTRPTRRMTWSCPC